MYQNLGMSGEQAEMLIERENNTRAEAAKQVQEESRKGMQEMTSSITAAKEGLKQITESVNSSVKGLAEQAGLTITTGTDGKLRLHNGKKRKHGDGQRELEAQMEKANQEEVEILEEAVVGMQAEADRSKKKGKNPDDATEMESEAEL